MSAVKRLTPPQSRKVNALVKRECCNCINGKCLLLQLSDSGLLGRVIDNTVKVVVVLLYGIFNVL